MRLFMDYVFLQIYFNRKGRKGLRKEHKVLKKICESVAKKRGLRFVMFALEIIYIFENHTKGFVRKRLMLLTSQVNRNILLFPFCLLLVL